MLITEKHLIPSARKANCLSLSPTYISPLMTPIVAGIAPSVRMISSTFCAVLQKRMREIQKYTELSLHLTLKN